MTITTLPIDACKCGCGVIESSNVIIERIPEDLSCSIKELEDRIKEHETYEIYDQSYLDCLYGAMGIYSKTDLKRGFETYKKAQIWDPNFPVVEDQEDGSFIVRNIPKNQLDESFLRSLSKTLTSYEICDSPDDITIIDDVVYIVPAHCKKKDFLLKATDEDWCKDNCDSLAFGLGWGCSNLRNGWCISSCMTTVEVMRRTCKYCCEDRGFLQRCLWPLADYFPRCDCDDLEWWM